MVRITASEYPGCRDTDPAAAVEDNEDEEGNEVIAAGGDAAPTTFAVGLAGSAALSPAAWLTTTTSFDAAYIDRQQRSRRVGRKQQTARRRYCIASTI